jgi:two-component sensor histidine kinase
MQDLRIRFGAILALALLPILIFAVVQSFFDFKSYSQGRKATLKTSAVQAASEILDTLNNARAILRVSGNIVDTTQDCDAALDQILRAIPRLDYLGVAEPSGRYVCRANNPNTGEASYNFEVLPTTENPFITETRTPKGESERYEAAIVMSYGVFEGNTLKKVILAGFKLKDIKALTDRSKLADDTNIAIINRNGEALMGGRTQTPEIRRRWIQTIQEAGHYEGQVKDPNGNIRDIFVVESGTDGLYVAISTPESSLVSWSVLNPFSSLIVPFFAWLFGFGAIWLAADKLILIHLRRMRKVALEFADGSLDNRIGQLNNPPQSIHTLGRSFDFMADKLSEREAALSDSLDEKETLLREIHHRVKNNLQIIISLLNMQERKLTDENGLTAITETRSRINAIALVHRGLYESSDLRYVNMQTFLERLTAELAVALGMEDRNIEVSIDADCAPMEADTATPVALFIVEALTNSVKHGVGHGGDILISIKQNEALVNVCVSDSGGAAMLNGPASAGTGTKLIRGFARQLGGNYTVNSSGERYEVNLEFELRKT